MKSKPSRDTSTLLHTSSNGSGELITRTCTCAEIFARLRRRRSRPGKLPFELFDFDDELESELADLLRASAEVVWMVLINTPQVPGRFLRMHCVPCSPLI